MNAQLAWLRWQADGTPVPLAVCEALMFLADWYIDNESDNGGDVGLRCNEGLVGPWRDTDGDAVILRYQPMPLTPETIAKLKKWVRHVESRVDAWSPEVHAMYRSREVRAWAQLPGPVTEGSDER